MAIYKKYGEREHFGKFNQMNKNNEQNSVKINQLIF